MKFAKCLLIFAILAAMVLPLAACGGEKEAGTSPTQAAQAPTNTVPPAPTNTPLPKPTDTPPPPPPTDTPPPPPPTDTPPPEAAEEPLDVSGLEKATDLNSFRSRFEISWQGTYTDGTPANGSMVVAVEFVREPKAEHLTISGDFAGMKELGVEPAGALEMYVVGDTMYTNLFGSWMQMPAQEGGLGAEEMAFTTTDKMLEGLEKPKYEGKETYNGIQTKHYSFDERSFKPENLSEGMKIDKATGNLYIAVEGNYLVHMDLTLSGSGLELPMGQEGQVVQNGSMTIKTDLSDINQPITIQVPEEALQTSGAPQDIPVPADAEGLSNAFGMITFTSASTPQQIADFYKAEMPKNGWTESNAEEFSGMYTLEYTKEGRTASFIISTDSTTGKTSVLITVKE